MRVTYNTQAFFTS